MEIAFRETVAEARERGQTIFLSSHILTEVEALCDRVGILRAGRLVDEGSLAELKHLAAQTFEIEFAGAVPDVSRVPGVRILQRSDTGLKLELIGSPAPLLQAIAGADVVSIRTKEPSLEEVFLHHYDGSDVARD